MTISEVTRRDILDLIIARKHPFHGRLDVLPFLNRIWDLSSLPSTDGRFTSATDDIFQHYVDWPDWDDKYLLYQRLNLLRCDDNTFLAFVEQVLHPEVLGDDQERLVLVETINRYLESDGYVLTKRGKLGIHSVYKAEPLDANPQEMHDQYDVALSYAGEDRDYVEQVASFLKSHGVRVFYDRYEEATLWGKDLTEHLDQIYRDKAKHCVMFISEHYASKAWTNHERRSALARAINERAEYILPARFDETDIPGIRPTIAYVNLRLKTPEQLGELILQKLGGASNSHVHDSTYDSLPITPMPSASSSTLLREWRPNLQTIDYVNIRRLMQDSTAIDLLADLQHNNIGRLNSLREVDLVGRIVAYFQRFLKRWAPPVLELRDQGVVNTDNTGARVHFNENFRTKNFPAGDERAFSLSHDIKKDPHMYCDVDGCRIYVEIDPRWVTTTSAISDFRPTGGHARFSGVGYITQVTAEFAIIKPLIIGLPKPDWDLSPF